MRKLLENIAITCNFTNGGATSVHVALYQNGNTFVKNLTATPITTSTFVANDGTGVNTIPVGADYTIRIVDSSDSNLYSVLDPGVFDMVASPDVVYPSVPWLNDTGFVFNAAGGSFLSSTNLGSPISLTNTASNINEVAYSHQGKYPTAHTQQFNISNTGQPTTLQYNDVDDTLSLRTFGGSSTGNSSRHRLLSATGNDINNTLALHIWFTFQTSSSTGSWFAYNPVTSSTSSLSSSGVGINLSTDSVRLWGVDLDFSANVDFSDGNPHMVEIVTYTNPVVTPSRVIVDDTHTLTDNTTSSTVPALGHTRSMFASNNSSVDLNVFTFDVKAGELIGTDLTDVRAWHKNQAGIP